jgi:hypothetical protein
MNLGAGRIRPDWNSESTMNLSVGWLASRGAGAEDKHSKSW